WLRAMLLFGTAMRARSSPGRNDSRGIPCYAEARFDQWSPRSGGCEIARSGRVCAHNGPTMDERTLSRGVTTTTELEIRRSRFITWLRRAEDEEAARDLVEEARHTYPDARHHCSAFVVRVPGANLVERSSDDGEPAGTAGMPMLEVLRGSGLVDVSAVVIRYFGGVKLGTGGLVRAYS